MRHVKLNVSIPAKTGQQGFTLLELLIASLIFAIMATMAYGGLDNVIRNSQSSQQALQRLQQIQQAVAVLDRDFSQIVQRPIRDEFGNSQPFLSAADSIDILVEFSRGGRVNPADLLRSTLLRVAYRFEDEQLIRLQWPQLDRARESEPGQTMLLDNLEEISVRFLDNNAEWQQQWPPVETSTTTAAVAPVAPLAIEVTLQLKDWGEIRRLYAMN